MHPVKTVLIGILSISIGGVITLLDRSTEAVGILTMMIGSGIVFFGLLLYIKQNWFPPIQEHISYLALKAKDEKITVLKQMLKNGTITQAEYDERIKKFKQ